MLNTVSFPEMKFPEGFIWGSATAGHQIEGDNIHSDNWHKEIKHSYPALSGKACDHWRLYREDIDMIKELGHQGYRLSLNWARLEPEQGKHDQAALTQYIDMLSRLKERGIKTFVTISHGGNPQWFAELGEFGKRANLVHFEKHVEWLVPKIKDYVDFWMVINEFNIGGGDSVAAADYRANCLVAHARGYHIIKKYSDCPVSSAHALRACHPANPFDRFDRQFAELDDWLCNEFFFHAIRTGEIVFPYRDAEYIPELKDSLDYWAINYYCRRIISARKKKIDGDWYTATHTKMIDMNFYLEEFYPEGLSAGLMRLKDKPVYITENGISCDDDRWRILKLAQDLAAMHDAIKNGVDLRGYLHWTLMDNYEWSSFVPRFGLVHVDFETFKRTPKPSAFFFRELIEQNGFDGELVRKYLPEIPVLKLYK